MSPGVPQMGYTHLNLLDSPVSLNLSDFNCRNKALTAKLLRQGYRYFKLRKAFLKFYRRHSALVENYSVSLKTLLQQGISEPEFYGDLVYRFRKIVGKSNFSEQFRKLIKRYKRIGYSLDIMRQTACLAVNPIIVDGYTSLFNCTTAVRASDLMTAPSGLRLIDGLFVKLTSRLRLDDMSLAWPAVVHLLVFIYSGILELAMSTRFCLSWWLIWFLCFRFDALTELGAFMRTEFLYISVLRLASRPRVVG